MAKALEEGINFFDTANRYSLGNRWQPTPLPVGELVERQTALRQACEQIGRVPIPTRMSFRLEISAITGNAPPSGSKRLVGHGTPAEVAGDLY